MKLRINNIFYSLQGEGRNTGRAAVFVRFAGCNMHCDFCDTDFSRFTEMTAADVVNTIADYPCRFVVLTGGEPTLQVDEAFVDILHSHGYEVAMESNGSMPAPRNIDWLTVSPKEWWKTEGEWWMENIDRINELKVVFDEDTPSRLSTLHLQPSTLHQSEATMKKQRIIELAVKVIVAALTAFLTAIGTTSCMGRGPF